MHAKKPRSTYLAKWRRFLLRLATVVLRRVDSSSLLPETVAFDPQFEAAVLATRLAIALSLEK